mmetsp:Transcript_14675/g.26653  ORF Transcript_14675/g.26653 Transcript_14675/m.26653 type:complete len:141 (-) Transcript_14675:41-463(-)
MTTATTMASSEGTASSPSSSPILSTQFVSPSPKNHLFGTLSMNIGARSDHNPVSIPQLRLSEDKGNAYERSDVRPLHHRSSPINEDVQVQEQQQQGTPSDAAPRMPSIQRLATLSDANLLMDLNKSSPSPTTQQSGFLQA